MSRNTQVLAAPLKLVVELEVHLQPPTPKQDEARPARNFWLSQPAAYHALCNLPKLGQREREERMNCRITCCWSFLSTLIYKYNHILSIYPSGNARVNDMPASMQLCAANPLQYATSVDSSPLRHDGLHTAKLRQENLRSMRKTTSSAQGSNSSSGRLAGARADASDG